MIRADSQLFRIQNYQEMSLLVCVFGNNMIMTIEVERGGLIVGMAFPVLDSMKQRSEGLRTSIRVWILLGFLMCSCHDGLDP